MRRADRASIVAVKPRTTKGKREMIKWTVLSRNGSPRSTVAALLKRSKPKWELWLAEIALHLIGYEIFAESELNQPCYLDVHWLG